MDAQNAKEAKPPKTEKIPKKHCSNVRCPVPV
jgi:hypothetical protein